MRLIDADAMKEWLDEYLSVFKKYDKSEVKGFVEHQPTIDAVSVVRCKECNAWNGEDDFGRCDVHLIGTYADDFCSYGVKKGADDEID